MPERCACRDRPPLVLTSLPDDGPLLCFQCNHTVDPSTLDLPEGVRKELDHWYSIASALERLELDAGSYEEWAQWQLLDAGGETNVEGLKVRASIDEHRPCYFSFFQRMLWPEGRYEVPQDCPICSGSLTAVRTGRRSCLACATCKVLLANA
jgi:hypothetical protein